MNARGAESGNPIDVSEVWQRSMSGSSLKSELLLAKLSLLAAIATSLIGGVRLVHHAEVGVVGVAEAFFLITLPSTTWTVAKLRGPRHAGWFFIAPILLVIGIFLFHLVRSEPKAISAFPMLSLQFYLMNLSASRTANLWAIYEEYRRDPRLNPKTTMLK